jgi:hypothetical protein
MGAVLAFGTGAGQELPSFEVATIRPYQRASSGAGRADAAQITIPM